VTGTTRKLSYRKDDILLLLILLLLLLVLILPGLETIRRIVSGLYFMRFGIISENITAVLWLYYV